MDNAHMDENKPRRHWLRFGVRDLLWVMVLVAITSDWWVVRWELWWRLQPEVEHFEVGDTPLGPTECWPQLIEQANRRSENGLTPATDNDTRPAVEPTTI
jgi:hypothetical protein